MFYLFATERAVSLASTITADRAVSLASTIIADYDGRCPSLISTVRATPPRDVSQASSVEPYLDDTQGRFMRRCAVAIYNLQYDEPDIRTRINGEAFSLPRTPSADARLDACSAKAQKHREIRTIRQEKKRQREITRQCENNAEESFCNSESASGELSNTRSRRERAVPRSDSDRFLRELNINSSDSTSRKRPREE